MPTTPKEVEKLKRRIKRLEAKIRRHRVIFKQIVRWDDRRFATLIQDNIGITKEEANKYFLY